MEYENMRLLKLKPLTRDRGLRNYSWMRKTELVALLQNNGTQEGSRATPPHTRPPPPPPYRHAKAWVLLPAYVTLKFDDDGSCRIHTQVT